MNGYGYDEALEFSGPGGVEIWLYEGRFATPSEFAEYAIKVDGLVKRTYVAQLDSDYEWAVYMLERDRYEHATLATYKNKSTAVLAAMTWARRYVSETFYDAQDLDEMEVKDEG